MTATQPRLGSSAADPCGVCGLDNGRETHHLYFCDVAVEGQPLQEVVYFAGGCHSRIGGDPCPV